jgi:hypothetical protein
VRPSLSSIVVLASFAIAMRSWAIPPAICHDSLNGVLFSSVSGAFTARVRLSVTVTVDGETGEPTLAGRYRCKRDAKHPERCTGSGTKAAIDGQPADLQSPIGIQYSMRLFNLHPGFSVRCELNASPAFFLSPGCIGGMVGTYTCHDGNEQTDRGSFALVGSCRQCRVPPI